MNEPSGPATARAPWTTSAQRLVLLGSLYFAQGLPYGFFTKAVPGLLRQQGVSLSKIGFAALLASPWALKFLWAPLVDRYSFRRLGLYRSWIVPMQLGAIFTLVTLAMIIGPTDLKAMMIGVFFLNLFAATQDIATDGFAVNILTPSERGLANGLQVACYRLGMIVGGGALLAYYEQLGLSGILWAMAGLTALASAPVWLSKPPARAAAAASTSPALAPAAPAFVHFLRLPGVWRVLLLLLLYKAGTNLSTGMLSPFLVDAGMSLGDIGTLLGTVGSVAGLLGAMTGGALVTPLGRRRALFVFGLCQAAAVAGYLALTLGTPSKNAIAAACFAEHFASGLGTASLFTAMMDWSRPRHAATDYTVQASAVVIATLAVAMASGLLADAVGYTGLFIIAASLCLLGTAAVVALFPRNFLAAAAAADAEPTRQSPPS